MIPQAHPSQSEESCHAVDLHVPCSLALLPTVSMAMDHGPWTGHRVPVAWTRAAHRDRTSRNGRIRSMVTVPVPLQPFVTV